MKTVFFNLLILLILANIQSILCQCNSTKNDLGFLTLPPGFTILPYHDGKIQTARSIALSGNSKMGGPWITYVASMDFSLKGSRPITALIDWNGRGKADYTVSVVTPDLYQNAALPNGIAWYRNSLYIAALSPWKDGTVTGGWLRLYRVDNIDAIALANRSALPSEIKLIRDDFPAQFMHGWKYIKFDKQGNLYIPIGSPMNIGLVNGSGTDGAVKPSPPNTGFPLSSTANSYKKNATSARYYYASIYKFTQPITATSPVQWVAHGVRNTVGIEFHPVTGHAFFTDNGRDNIGGNSGSPASIAITDNAPDCELNYLGNTAGTFTVPRYFGYPYCHSQPSGNVAKNAPFRRPPGVGKGLPDPDVNILEKSYVCNPAGNAPRTFIPAVQALGPHMAPLGLRFYSASGRITTNLEGGQDYSPPNFPLDYNNSLFVAVHGSWNRQGGIIGGAVYRVRLQTLGTSQPGTSGVGTPTKFGLNIDAPNNVITPSVRSYEPWLTGGVPGDKGNNPNGPQPPIKGGTNLFLSRPVDLQVMPDGSMLVSDDQQNRVLRIAYCGTSKDPLTYGGEGAPPRLGIGRCGSSVKSFASIPSMPSATSRSVRDWSKGCTVNVKGMFDNIDSITYQTCQEYDITTVGNPITIAYSITKVPNQPNGEYVLLHVSMVVPDYTDQNADGWVGFGMSPDGYEGSMIGMNAIMARPNAASKTGASANDYTMGDFDTCPEYGLNCFKSPTVGWLFDPTNVTGPVTFAPKRMQVGLVGNAMVVTFTAYMHRFNVDPTYVPSTDSPTATQQVQDSNTIVEEAPVKRHRYQPAFKRQDFSLARQPIVLTMGKMNGSVFQEHWSLGRVYLPMDIKNLDATPQLNGKIVNPGLAWGDGQSNVTVSLDYPSAAKNGFNCNIGDTLYTTCTNTTDAGIPITHYYTIQNGLMQVALRAKLDGLNGKSKGWIAWAFNSDSPGSMLNSQAAVARYCAGCQNGARGQVLRLGAYATGGMELLTNSMYSNVTASSQQVGSSTILTLQFSIPWQNGFMAMYAAGPDDGSIDYGAKGMRQHVTPAGARACVRQTGLGGLSSCGGCK